MDKERGKQASTGQPHHRSPNPCAAGGEGGTATEDRHTLVRLRDARVVGLHAARPRDVDGQQASVRLVHRGLGDVRRQLRPQGLVQGHRPDARLLHLGDRGEGLHLRPLPPLQLRGANIAAHAMFACLIFMWLATFTLLSSAPDSAMLSEGEMVTI